MSLKYEPSSFTIRPNRPISDLGFTLRSALFGGSVQVNLRSENGPFRPTEKVGPRVSPRVSARERERERERESERAREREREREKEREKEREREREIQWPVNV